MKRILLSVLALAVVLPAVHAKRLARKSNAAAATTLTAYYAYRDFSANGTEYKKGQLIVDTNDPLNRMVSLNATSYKYEGDDTGEYYSWKIPKKNVTVQSYAMSELAVSALGEGVVFVADDGREAKIFKSHNNGHSYYSCDDDFNAYLDTRATDRLDGCYVLSVPLSSGYVFEEPLSVSNGHLVLYVKNRFGSTGVRRRAGKIGIIEEEWVNKEGYPEETSAFDSKGNLLVDQYTTKGSIAEYISIAYIDALKALYVGGTLFYLK